MEEKNLDTNEHEEEKEGKLGRRWSDCAGFAIVGAACQSFEEMTPRICSDLRH